MISKKILPLCLAAVSAAFFLPSFPVSEAATQAQINAQRQAQLNAQRQQQYYARQQAIQNRIYQYYQNGVNAYQSKNYSTAISYLTTVAKYQHKKDIYEMLGDSYLQLKQPSQAYSYLKKAFELGSRDETVIKGLGYAALGIGNTTEAKNVLKKCMNMYGDDIDLAWQYGMLCYKDNDADGLIAAMKRVISIQPAYKAEAYSYLGIALNKNGDTKIALNVFAKGLEYFPNDAELNFHVGDNLYAAGEYEKCIPYLQKSLKLNDGNLDAYWTLGMAYVQIDDLDDAQEVCAVMSKIAPKDSRTVELCKVVNEKVQQKMLEQQMQQNMMNQQMQQAMDNTGAGTDAQAMSDAGAMAMAMGQ